MRKVYRTRLLLLEFVVTAIVLPIGATAADPFVKVQLPKGLSIELPSNWVMLSNNQRITLDSSAMSRVDLSGIEFDPSELPFAANCYDDRGTVVGIVNVRYYPTLDLTQDHARALSSSDVEELNPKLKADLVQSLNAFGMSVTSWGGTRRAEINGVAAFVTEYHRRSLKRGGDFRVRLVRVFAGSRSFTLTVSYLESASFLFQPITDRIVSSLALTDNARDASGGTTQQENSEVLSMTSEYFGEQWGVILLVSLLLTWGIGLVPPLLIRYVFARRSLAAGWAIGVVIFFWMFNIIFFSVLSGRSTRHAALALVAVASFAILRKPLCANMTETPSRLEFSVEGGEGMRLSEQAKPKENAIEICGVGGAAA